MHGPTFMGNPLACAVACASIDLLLCGDWSGNIPRINTGLTAGLPALRGAPGVHDVRMMGPVGVVALGTPVDGGGASDAALDVGMALRREKVLQYGEI